MLEVAEDSWQSNGVPAGLPLESLMALDKMAVAAWSYNDLVWAVVFQEPLWPGSWVEVLRGLKFPEVLWCSCRRSGLIESIKCHSSVKVTANLAQRFWRLKGIWINIIHILIQNLTQSLQTFHFCNAQSGIPWDVLCFWFPIKRNKKSFLHSVLAYSLNAGRAEISENRNWQRNEIARFSEKSGKFVFAVMGECLCGSAFSKWIELFLFHFYAETVPIQDNPSMYSTWIHMI